MAIINRPKLQMAVGTTYTFDVSDASNTTHPFRFTSDSGSTEYTTGVVVNGTQGQAGATVAFTPNISGPSILHYYCTAHGLSMGNEISITGLSTMNPYVLLHTIANPNAFGTPANDTFSDAISMSSTHVIAGAHQEDDAGIYSSGRAYIFDISNGSLVHTLANTAGYSTTDYDQFGDAVGISNSYAVVGAPRDQITSQYKPGYAHMYNVSDGTLRYSLANPWANSNNHLNTEQKFGHAVDINETYAIVGAIGQRHADQSSSADQGTGKAYVFNTSNGQLAHTLNNPRGPLAGDKFGQSVSISDTHAIVSSRGSGGDGAAFVYDNNFSLLYTLNNPNPSGASTDDYFGEGAAISNTHAIVAAPYEDSASTNDVGKAYIYDLSDGSLLHTLSNPGTDNYFAYGGAVGIDSDHAIVGAIYAGGSGKAYIFNVSDGSLKSTISSPSGQAGNYFGYGGVEIKGKKVAVGQPYYDDSAGNTAAGALYVYNDPTVPPVTFNRALFSGGTQSSGGSNTIEYMAIPTGGATTDFGDMNVNRGGHTSFGNSGRSVFANGETGTNTYSSNMEYVNPSTPGNAISFGSNDTGKAFLGAVADLTRGVIGGGAYFSGGWNFRERMDYVTINTTGSSSTFGNLSWGWAVAGSASSGDNTYGCWSGGVRTSDTQYVGYFSRITIQTTGNASSFGSFSSGYARAYSAGFSDANYSFTAGGINGGTPTYIDHIDRHSITTGGTGTNVASLSATKYSLAAANNPTHAVIGGGYASQMYNNIENFNMSTNAIASTFGTLSAGGRYRLDATSGA